MSLLRRAIPLAALLLASAAWARFGLPEKEVGQGLVPKGPARWEQRVGKQKLLLTATLDSGRAVALEWSCAGQFSPEALWTLLDQEARGGDWFEIARDVPVGAGIAEKLDADALQSWLLWRPLEGSDRKGLLADLTENSGRSFLRVREVEVSRPENRPVLRYREESFTDFVGSLSRDCFAPGKGRCLLAHPDDPSLEVEITPERVRFAYRSADTGRVELPANASRLKARERKELAQALLSLYRHDFDLAVRAFFATAPRFFDRQPWEWHLLGDRGFVTEAEIDKWIRKGKLPETVTIFRTKAQGPGGDRRLELSVRKGGLYVLEVR